MSKLDEIFEYDVLARAHGETKAIAKGKVKDLMLEIIGEDYDTSGNTRNPYPTVWVDLNKQKAELRKKVEEL